MTKTSAYQDLRERIMQGQFLPGERLLEREVGKTYGMSRTPVREILWRLVSDGLLEQADAGGFSVRTLTLKQIFDLFQAREAVEGTAARIACQKAKESFFSTLKELREQLEHVDAGTDGGQGFLIGRRLHDSIVEAAGNELLLEFYRKAKNLAALIENVARRPAAMEQRSRDYHLQLIESLEQKDEERSEQIMREHLRTACRLLVENFYPGAWQ